jgi:predicted signal transduction protein with EAL and GGDEF domain
MRVTVSAGIATLEPNDTPDTVLARADGALYEAKARGRNRIVCARSDYEFLVTEKPSPADPFTPGQGHGFE